MVIKDLDCIILFLFFLLLFSPLLRSQTGAVGPVLRVNDQLHLELSSQCGLCYGLLFLLNGFDLCLQNKILVSLNVVGTKFIKQLNINFIEDGYLGCFQKVGKSSEITLGQV